MSLDAFTRCWPGLPNVSTELAEFVLGIAELAIDNAQTNDQRAQVDPGRCRHRIRHFKGGLPQYAKNGLGIHAPDAMLLEQLLDS